jgi:hypothetical protein
MKTKKTETNRGLQFIDFAKKVVGHIDNYTIPQYGDAPDDMIDEWSVEECRKQILRYTQRMTNNQRGHDDNLLTCLKIAHYACFLHEKLQKEV